MYAHKIPNFEIGLQVGCKFSIGVAVIGNSVKTKLNFFMPQWDPEFRDRAFAQGRATVGREHPLRISASDLAWTVFCQMIF